MKIHIIALLTVVCATVRVEAQETLPAAAPPAGPGAPAAVGPAQWSYAIGLDMGKSFGASKVAIDLDSLIAGFRDGIAGKEPQYSPEV